MKSHSKSRTSNGHQCGEIASYERHQFKKPRIQCNLCFASLPEKEIQANSGNTFQRNQKEALHLPHDPKFRRQSQIFILSSATAPIAVMHVASALHNEYYNVILDDDDSLPSSSLRDILSYDDMEANSRDDNQVFEFADEHMSEPALADGEHENCEDEN